MAARPKMGEAVSKGGRGGVNLAGKSCLIRWREVRCGVAAAAAMMDFGNKWGGLAFSGRKRGRRRNARLRSWSPLGAMALLLVLLAGMSPVLDVPVSVML